ncbi:hypothetical protein JXO59_03655 [candidate division KSB1 bacterium]|nr:hypothetical protein [candidate division KSB1 bacterium]
MKIRRIALMIGILSIFSISLLSAQTAPIAAGKMMLSGDLSFSSFGGDLYENEAGDKLTTISVNPTFGYFVMKGLQVGAIGMFQNLSWGKDKETFIGVGPYVAYFLGSGQEEGKGKTYPYAAAGFVYYTGSSETEYYLGEDSQVYEQDISGTGLLFSLGFVHMLTNSIGFDTGVSYHINSLEYEPKGETGETFDGETLNISFGILAFF